MLVAPRAEMPSACGGSSLMRVSQPESLGATDLERRPLACILKSKELDIWARKDTVSGGRRQENSSFLKGVRQADRGG